MYQTFIQHFCSYLNMPLKMLCDRELKYKGIGATKGGSDQSVAELSFKYHT